MMEKQNENNLKIHINMYKEELESDFSDFLHELDVIKLDFNNPTEILEIILTKAGESEAKKYLTSILQHFLAISKYQDSTFDKYLQLIDQIVAQIVLDGKGINPSFTSIYKIDLDSIIQGFVSQDKLKELETEVQLQKKNTAFEISERAQQLKQFGNFLGFLI